MHCFAVHSSSALVRCVHSIRLLCWPEVQAFALHSCFALQCNPGLCIAFQLCFALVCLVCFGARAGEE